jgi:predicted porin
MDWRYKRQTFEFCGEIARSKNKGHAVLSGARLYFNMVRLAFLYRNYQRNFHNLHGFGFGERNGDTQNEKGFYTGIAYKLNPKIKLSAYYDFYKFPWRSYFEPMPISGREFLSQAEYKISSQMRVKLRYRYKSRQQLETFLDIFEREFKEFIAANQQQIRIELNYSVSKNLVLRNRVEFVTINYQGFARQLNSENENGFLIYQDIRLKPVQCLEIVSRLSFFEADSYEARLFQYENDLPGVVTNRALIGRGTRWFLLFKYKPRSRINL